ncbi:hypothetical protein TrST_g12442 [Triparma strigata]|uniref:Uncharacterized protein n=1 Tax=Triparma strigata TaxID=1606541 RepID=A0A9W7AYI8_9STRA|nr:hypothetical protein TrST_g12442 [Triparma strigata]
MPSPLSSPISPNRSHYHPATLNHSHSPPSDGASPRRRLSLASFPPAASPTNSLGGCSHGPSKPAGAAPGQRLRRSSLARATQVEKLKVDSKIEEMHLGNFNRPKTTTTLDIDLQESPFNLPHQMKKKKTHGKSPLFSTGLSKGGIDPRSREKGIMPPSRRHSLTLSPKKMESFTVPSAPSVTPTAGARLGEAQARRERLDVELVERKLSGAEVLQSPDYETGRKKKTPSSSQKTHSLVIAFEIDDNQDSSPLTLLEGEVFLQRCSILNMQWVDDMISPPTPHSLALKMSNPAEQFERFVCIVKSLIHHLPGERLEFDAFVDSSTISNAIVAWCDKKGFEGRLKVANLRKGFGKDVLSVLAFVVGKVEEARVKGTRTTTIRRTFEENEPPPPSPNLSSASDEDSIADEIEIEDDAVEKGEADFEPVLERSFIMIDPVVDPIIWRKELENVSARLTRKLGNGAGGGSWRDHLRQARESAERICGEGNLAPGLEFIRSIAGGDRETIFAREKSLSALETVHQLSLRNANILSEIDVVCEQHAIVEASLGKATDALEIIEEQLRETKLLAEERASSMSDTSGLVKMKNGLKKLKADTTKLDLEIGMAQSAILARKLEDSREVLLDDNSDDNDDDEDKI